MLYFDHFSPAAAMATRSLGRMRGVANMAPAGGIMCALVVPAILCDFTDSRFGRATVYCIIACFFSLFGLMHGNNYVFPDGSQMHANPHSTDLGEVMLSTARFPSTHYFGFPIDTSNYTYAVNEAGPTNRVANEGWRFAVAYAALAVFSAGHALFQKMKPGVCPTDMGNGWPDGAEPAAGKHETASA